jgi:hypothetical protein
MNTDCCIEVVEGALAKYGTPEIVNTDQGSQFTSAEFTSLLQTNGIAISMDGEQHGAIPCLSSDCGRGSVRMGLPACL